MNKLIPQIVILSTLSLLFILGLKLFTKNIPKSSKWEDRSIRVITTKLPFRRSSLPIYRVRYYRIGTFDSTCYYKQEEYYESGQLAERFELDTLGLKHGIFEQWYGNGQKGLEATMTHGLNNGGFRTWLPDGTDLEFLEYKMGEVVRNHFPDNRMDKSPSPGYIPKY